MGCSAPLNGFDQNWLGIDDALKIVERLGLRHHIILGAADSYWRSDHPARRRSDWPNRIYGVAGRSADIISVASFSTALVRLIAFLVKFAAFGRAR